jgi:hypothetical protein
MLQPCPSAASPSPSRSWLILLRIVVMAMLATGAAGCASLPSNVSRQVSRAFNAPD